MLSVNLNTDAASPLNDGNLTLREAIAYVNGVTPQVADLARINTNGGLAPLGVNDTIIFDPIAFPTGIGQSTTILLTAGDPATNGTGFNGQLVISQDIKIIGPGRDHLIIDASGNDPDPTSTLADKQSPTQLNFANDGNGSRVFQIDSDTNATLSGLTLQGGDVASDGGAILNFGTLNLRDSLLRNNISTSTGGALAHQPTNTSVSVTTLTVTRTIFENNQSRSNGGAIAVSGGKSDISFSEIVGNEAGTRINNLFPEFSQYVGQLETGAGGGLFFGSVFGPSPIVNVRLANNIISDNETGTSGGGLSFEATSESSLVIDQCVISGNGVFRSEALEFSSGVDSPTPPPGPGGFGGGLYVAVVGDTDVLIKDSAVLENIAGNEKKLDPFSQDPVFVVAADGGFGGGGYFITSADTNGINNCTIRVVSTSVTDNKARHEGGGLFLRGKGIEVINSTIAKNVAEFLGGGLSIGEANANLQSRVKLRHSTVAYNRVADPTLIEPSIGGSYTTRSIGGGIFTDFDSFVLDHTIVAENSDTNSNNDGGNPFAGDYTISPDLGFSIRADRLTYDGDINTVTQFSFTGWEYSLVGNHTFSTLKKQNLAGQYEDFTVVFTGGAGNLASGTASGLGVLAENGAELLPNGSKMKTVPLLSTSAAVNAGNTALTLAAPPAYTFQGTETKLRNDGRAGGYARIAPKPGTTTPVRIDIGAYELQEELNPSTLPHCPAGDYNRNGKVDAADYNIWRESFGLTLTIAYSRGDGDGDFDVDFDDYRIWATHFGQECGSGAFSAFAFTPGDFNLDQMVDALDYQLWQLTYGSTTQLAADANGNGIIDNSDLAFWREMLGVTTLTTIRGDFNEDGVVDTADHALWIAGDLRADADGDGIVIGDTDDYNVWDTHFGTVRADLMPLVLNNNYQLPFEIPDAAPTVVGVSISGTTTHDFTTIAGTGEQLRSLPVASPNKISIRFSEEVFVTQNALTVTNLDGASPASVTSFTYDLLNQTATWTFASSFADGRHLLQLNDSLYDLDREALDGEFTNPWFLTSTGIDSLPSGDGVAGGKFRFRYTVLAGDSDHNNIHTVGVVTTNYTNWQVTEPGMIYASNTTDEFDGDLSFGDVSLREAVNYANTQGAPIRIELPAGRFTLSRNGSESGADVAFNDLDILSDVTVVGAGPGFTIIDNSGLASGTVYQGRTFEVNGAAKKLKVAQLTIANGASVISGQVASVANGATLEIEDAAIVNHTAYAGGTALLVTNSTVSIKRSVFSNNDVTQNYGGAAVSVSGTTTAPASVTVGESIFAQNVQPGYYGGPTRYGVLVSGTVTKTNLGKNLYDYANGGFFDVATNVTDYLGTPTYVVMSVADTFNHADDIEALSLREAVDLANTTAGTQEIWLPAWKFTLTRDRASYGGGSLTDIDAAFGDLDVKDSLIVRGVTGRTSVAWKAGIVDEVFDLLGDYNNDGEADAGNVSSADYTIWQNQNGSVGAWEQFSADGDDDGDVDSADYTLWSQYFGKTLGLFGVSA